MCRPGRRLWNPARPSVVEPQHRRRSSAAPSPPPSSPNGPPPATRLRSPLLLRKRTLYRRRYAAGGSGSCCVAECPALADRDGAAVGRWPQRSRRPSMADRGRRTALGGSLRRFRAATTTLGTG
ncbi:hypothetical protein ACP70R_036597 [Stipagrostis hirtigluma subsp. patula]